MVIKITNIANINPHIVEQYVSDFNISKILSKTLINRGFNYQLSKEILLEPHKLILDPKILTNSEKAATRIVSHLKNNSFIFIFADYDVDGLTSGYVAKEAFMECNNSNRIQVYYPNRKEGYGINKEWINHLIKSMDKHNIDPKDVLVITVDNGINKIEEVEILNNKGIEIIITDHHNSLNEVPNCLIVNPNNKHEKQHEDTIGLSGCAVIFKVAQIVQEKYNKFNMLKYTPYVALSTIADMMPMTLENIALIKFGLNIINSDYCPQNISMFKDYYNKQEMNSKDLAFDISPKLNSCGRIDKIEIASMFLFEEDEDLKRDYFIEIFNADNRRKKYEKEASKNIDFDKITIEDKVVISEIEDVPVGVLGIIANRIKKETNLPSIVLQDNGDYLTGSARSVDSVNLLEVVKKINKNSDIILDYGGHSASLGLSIKKDRTEDFKKLLEENIVDEDLEIEERIVDEVISIKDINMDNYRDIYKIPFNNLDLLPPFVALEGVEIKKIKHSKNNFENICFTIKDDTGILDVWAWGFGSEYIKLGEPKKINIYGELDVNFMKPKFATIRVLNIKPLE